LSFTEKWRRVERNNLKIMEDSEILKTEKTSSIVSALGLLGLGVGVIALALGVFAMIKVGDTTAEMNDKIEKAAALSLDMKKLGDRVDSVSAQLDSLKGGNNERVDSLARQTQSAVNEIIAQINAVKGEIAADRKAIEGMAKSPRASAAAPAASEAKASESAKEGEQKAVASGDQKTYKIQSGDTFAKLAKKFNVSVDAIKAANPSANPSKLKIGQEIAIP